MKTNKIIYWIATGLLSLMMLGSATMYFIQHEAVAEVFKSLGFPIYIIYPLAIAKILGVIAIVTRKSPALKEWAYAGFFFDFVLASSAHIMAGDGQFAPAIVALVLLFTSYFFERKI